ncbi:MAG: hypothetical protein R3C27_03455 [Hyphomonadaceae bacterium]
MFDREHITDAIKFWERGRVVYNLALVAISLAVLAPMGFDQRTWFVYGSLLLFLAVMANLLYCVAYPVDLFVQASDFRDAWRTLRWTLLAFGTLFAMTQAYLLLGGPYVLGFPGGPHG